MPKFNAQGQGVWWCRPPPPPHISAQMALPGGNLPNMWPAGKDRSALALHVLQGRFRSFHGPKWPIGRHIPGRSGRALLGKAVRRPKVIDDGAEGRRSKCSMDQGRLRSSSPAYPVPKLCTGCWSAWPARLAIN